MKRRYKWVCERCGSDEIIAEGQAFWNRDLQEWDWEWNDTYCVDCSDLANVIKEDLPPEISINSEII
jgi:hypothetical protein